MPIIDTRVRASGPLPIRVAPLSGAPTLPPCLDLVGLCTGENELAGRDVDLTAAEGDRVDPLVDRTDDLLLIKGAGQHVGVGHARHRRVGKALAPAVPRRRDAHKPGIHPILHEPGQDAVLDQHVALRGRPLVVHGYRAAAGRRGSRRRSRLPPGAATRLPINPAKADVFLRLKSPSRPWPTASCNRIPGQPGPEDDRDLSRRRRHRAEVHQGLP